MPETDFSAFFLYNYCLTGRHLLFISMLSVDFDRQINRSDHFDRHFRVVFDLWPGETIAERIITSVFMCSGSNIMRAEI